MVPQWDLLNLLADEAGREPAFSLRLNTEAIGFLRERGRVTGVRYRAADGTTGELRATLTVACDGRSSLAKAAARAGRELDWDVLARRYEEEILDRYMPPGR